MEYGRVHFCRAPVSGSEYLNLLFTGYMYLLLIDLRLYMHVVLRSRSRTWILVNNTATGTADRLSSTRSTVQPLPTPHTSANMGPHHLLLLIVPGTSVAKVSQNRLYSDDMILESREAYDIRPFVSGFGDTPGEKVEVTFVGRTYPTTVGAQPRTRIWGTEFPTVVVSNGNSYGAPGFHFGTLAQALMASGRYR
eukprot:SAG31_NODE_4348_length_3325_cov_1.733416_7_plen_194_part_00